MSLMACLPKSIVTSNAVWNKSMGMRLRGGKVPGAEPTSGVTQANGINREADIQKTKGV